MGEPFKNIRFKQKTVKRFQEFSKANFKTHTEALETMLDFFYHNQISPKENFGTNLKTLEKALKERINAIIAIMRDIEKTQTKPTVAILNALMEQHDTQKEPALKEKKTFPQEENYWNINEE